MPAATTKAELLAATDKEWLKLVRLMDQVTEPVAMQTDADATSIRDIAVHRAHWIGLFFQWLEEGEAAQMPDHGVKWSELKPYSAGIRERNADLPWAEARTRIEDGHARLRAWIAQATDAQLYGGPMPGGNGKWTTGRYAEASGSSHYRSAAKYIRAVLKETPKG